MKFISTILFFLSTANCFAQVFSNSGVINISSNTVLTGSSLSHSSGTITNSGTINLSSGFTNSATVNGNGDYYVGGNWTNSGTFTTGTGTFYFNGSNVQTIDATSFSNVAFTNANTKTLLGNINVTGTLTLGGNATLSLSSYNITLKSSSSATARVASVPTTASITYGTGKFISERYVQGRRKYRLMTSSVTTSNATTLSAGQESLSIWGNWQNSGNTSTTNAGTFITGGSTSDGFDTQSDVASLYTYDDAARKFIGFTSANGKNTKYTPLKAGIPYYMFIYGDRTNAIYANPPNATVLTATGTITTGDQTYNTTSTLPLSNVAGRYTMIGNPFPSPINWATVQKTNISDTYWGWDPNLNTTGGYVTVSTAGSVTLISPYSGSTQIDQYIQSGQAFFVRTTATSPSLVIREDDKVSNNNTNAFRTAANVSLMAINLFYENSLVDGTITVFEASLKNKTAAKIQNSAETVSIANGSELLSINMRKLPEEKDTITLNIARLTEKKYTLEIFAQNVSSLDYKPYLEDRFTKSYTELSLIDTNKISFNVTSNAASADALRFRIVFSKSVLANNVVKEIKVYPNPVKDILNLITTDLPDGQYDVTLLSTSGQQVEKKVFDHLNGVNVTTIQIDKHIAQGTYFLQVKSDKNIYKQTIYIDR